MTNLNFKKKLAYGSGQFVTGSISTAFMLFLLFYYNQVLEVSGALCGMALLIATIVDAVTDPIMGSISDSWRSRFGRRHPFMYFAALPLGACFFFLFHPLVHSEFALFLWLLIFSVLTRLALTIYAVPHMALGGELTTDHRERMSVVAVRLVFNIVGMMAVYGLGLGFFFAASEAFPNGQLNTAAYPLFAGWFAIITVISALVTAWGTHHLIPSLSAPAESQGHTAKKLLLEVMDALQNLSFRWLLIGWIIVSAPIGVGSSLALYLNTFFWQVSPQEMIPVLGLSPLAMGIGYMFAPALSQYIEKRQALMWGALGWATFSIAPVCLYYAGFFPEPGTSGVVIGLSICSFLTGITVSQLPVAVESMLYDIAEEQELEAGIRQEGVFYGAHMFVSKASGGVGAAISGVALDLIDWPVGDNISTAADIPPDTLFQLAMIAGPGLAMGLLPALWCFHHITLDRQRNAEVLSALAERKRVAPSGSAT